MKDSAMVEEIIIYSDVNMPTEYLSNSHRLLPFLIIKGEKWKSVDHYLRAMNHRHLEKNGPYSKSTGGGFAARLAFMINAVYHKFTQFPTLYGKLTSFSDGTYFVDAESKDSNCLGKILTALSFLLKHGSCATMGGEISSIVRVKDSGDLKILSWNINGIRSKVLSSMDFKRCGSFTSIDPSSNLGLVVCAHRPDILCFQETRCDDSVWGRIKIDGYHQYWSCSRGEKARAGNRYSGVSVWTKVKPNRATYSIPTLPDPDAEGRVIILEFNEFVLVNTYSPNSGTNRDYRLNVWDKAMREYLAGLNKAGVSVVWAGDLNVSHKEEDVFFSRSNPTKVVAGYTPEERDNFSGILGEGYTDSLRHFYPGEADIYTWWNPKVPSDRLRNRGMRLDYFVVSDGLLSFVRNSEVLYDSGTSTSPHASDHAAIMLTLSGIN